MSPALNVAKRTTTLPHFELDQYDCAIPCVVPRTFVPLLSVKVPHPRGETTLANLSGIVKQLKKERDRVQHQWSGLNAALASFAGVDRNNRGTKPRRKMSARGRARIAAAQRARWARLKGQQKVVPIAQGRMRRKRTMPASARRKIAVAQPARWVKVRQQKKTA
jgi:hypothetical protein